jgi:hypothetical protein
MGVIGARRLTVASLCSLIACLCFSVSGALASAPPVVEEQAVLDVASTSATFQAKIDPEGGETTYRFEYGTSAAYGESVPVPDGIVGSGSVGVKVTAHPQDLSPSTEYHYRVVVAKGSETVPGGDGTFITQRSGEAFSLPDGRQWELVSPPNKHGATIASLVFNGPLQAAADGSGIVYGVNVPTELEPAGYSQQAEIEFIQARSDRGPGGWSTRDIATPRSSATGSFGPGPEYFAFSSDLSLGVVHPFSEGGTMLLSGEASEPTLYLRREGLCDAPASASACYLPLVTGKEGFADVPSGTEFGGFGALELEGVTPDLSKIVLHSSVALTSVPIPERGLYEWSGGAPAAERLQLVSVLPASEGGGPAPGSIFAGGGFGSNRSAARNAVSRDGSRIFWYREEGSGVLLYMRDTVRGETVRLDVKQPGAPNLGGGLPGANFQIANSDGSRVFFTDSQPLTPTSGGGGSSADLYECEIVEEAGHLACRLSDLTPERAGQQAKVGKYVLGGSEDGSSVYFVADGVVSANSNSEGEVATPGLCVPNPLPPTGTICNLYEYHDGVVKFVAGLSLEDEWDWSYPSFDFGPETARVSPDGRYAAFMSDRPLTHYDNRDASNGRPDMEVYLYDAQSERLVCASCNPTGSRPTGVEAGEFGIFNQGKSRRDIVDVHPHGFGGNYMEATMVAANLPGANTIDSVSKEMALYQPRLLSDDGRLFFNSSDALVPQDVNGEEDVYEFEPEGTGGCRAASVTFVVSEGGCVSLVSAGSSSEESGFLDASEGGDDVFFLTASRLTSQDYDTSLDIYDAHVCSASVPCVAPSVSPPPCDSGDSCKGTPAPQPAVFGAPASATFAGTGNVVPLPTTVARGKSLSRAQKLQRALRACRGVAKRKRLACERRARRLYGAKRARRGVGAARKARG